MATRYYPTRKSTNVIIHGPLNGNWNQGDSFRGQADMWAWRLQTTKTTDGGSSIAPQFWTNQQGNYDFPFGWRWMTYPLQAQSISGTFNCCFCATQWWDTVNVGASNNSVVRFKLHIYLAQGQSVIPRTILLDNYVDTVNLQYSSFIWQSLAAPQTLTPATVIAGDIIVIKLGCGIVSSPTPAPTYPPSQHTTIKLYSIGADPTRPDAVAGEYFSAAFDPWLEFSATIVEQALPAPPANDACADAIVIPSIPAVTAFVDSTQSADVKRAVWWTFVAPTTGVLHLTAHGTN